MAAVDRPFDWLDSARRPLTRRGLLRAFGVATLYGLGCHKGSEIAAPGARFDGFPITRLDDFLTPTADFFVRDHFDIPPQALAPPAIWRLQIGGEVAQSRSLTLSDLETLPRVELPVTLECAGNAGRNGLSSPGGPRAFNGAGTAKFHGFQLAELLRTAQPAGTAKEIVFEGADAGVERGDTERHTFARSVPIEDAMADGPLLVIGMNGGPLPALHGGPLRVVFPGRYATDSVKWLTAIKATTVPFDGFYQRRRYRKATAEHADGVPLGRLRVQCGIARPTPRTRLPGQLLVDVVGVAWGGKGGVVKVEVSVDGGTTFGAARFVDPPTLTAWRRWTFPWRPGPPGPRLLVARATDAAGEAQPLESDEEAGRGTSLSGPDRIQYANNAVPVVPVWVV